MMKFYVSTDVPRSPRGHGLTGLKQVEGPLNRGQVQVHMTRHPRQGDGDFEYKYLFIDIKNHHRIYLKNADEEKKAADAAAGKKFRFLGINWG